MFVRSLPRTTSTALKVGVAVAVTVVVVVAGVAGAVALGSHNPPSRHYHWTTLENTVMVVVRMVGSVLRVHSYGASFLDTPTNAPSRSTADSRIRMILLNVAFVVATGESLPECPPTSRSPWLEQMLMVGFLQDSLRQCLCCHPLPFPPCRLFRPSRSSRSSPLPDAMANRPPSVRTAPSIPPTHGTAWYPCRA